MSIRKLVRKIRPDFIVSFVDANGIAVGKLKVMKSNAGYYVGRSCLEDMGDGELLEQPYCRDSGYYSKEGAEAELAWQCRP